MLPHEEFIYRDEESAVIAVRLAIAAECGLDTLFVKNMIIHMDHEVLCHCKKSLSGVRGVCTIENKPYAAVRGFCANCGQGFYENESFVIKFNQTKKK